MRFVIFLLHLAIVFGRTFVDDAGVTHTTSAASPTVVTGSFEAISLMHFGVSHTQFRGTFGERATSGSNFGGVYADGNRADHGTHATGPYNPSLFPADPTAAELAGIAPIRDLSASCSATNYWCGSTFDHTILDTHGWPDFIFQGVYQGAYAISGFALGNATARGIPIITLSNTHTTEGSPPKGFIEITQRYEALATFLGVTEMASRTRNDKHALCGAVASFKAVTRAAQARGVRAMAAYAPYGPTGPAGEIGGFLAAPDKDQVLTMLEELGMPIIHTDAPQSGGWEAAVLPDYSAGTMSATNLMSSGALSVTDANPDGTPVPYNVDFWLYDVRVALDFTTAAFATAWPHPAVVAQQYAYWPSGGHVHSYTHATEILTLVGSALSTAQKTDPATTSCTPVEVINGNAHRTTGLEPGQYACHNPIEYDWCAEFTDMHAARADTGALGLGPVVGIAAGCFVAGLVVMLVITMASSAMCKKPTKAPKLDGL